MKYLTLLMIILLPMIAQAATKKWTYPENPKLDDELDNVYRSINSVPNGTYKSSSMTLQGITVDSITVNNFSSIKGVTDGSNAAAGKIGELLEVSNSNEPAWGCTSGQACDIDTISLTAGDWMVSAITGIDANGGSPTNFVMWLSATSGNSTTGQQLGINGAQYLVASGIIDAIHLAIPEYRISLTSTTPYYLKHSATWSGSAPLTYSYRFSARRIR